MLTFLFYTLLLAGAGILIRIFWVPLMILGAVVIAAIGIIISAAVTTIAILLIQGLITGGDFSGFSTYFCYSVVFFITTALVYLSIVGDIANMISRFLRNRQ